MARTRRNDNTPRRKPGRPRKVKPEVDAESPASPAPSTEAMAMLAHRLIDSFRDMATTLIERHDRAKTGRTRFDALQSYRKCDKFIQVAVGCNFNEKVRAAVANASPFPALFERFTKQGKPASPKRKTAKS